MRLRAEIATGRAVVMTGAGNGLAAKFIERGGVDLIGVYNTGYFRMQGYGSLAGMLPILDGRRGRRSLVRLRGSQYRHWSRGRRRNR